RADQRRILVGELELPALADAPQLARVAREEIALHAVGEGGELAAYADTVHAQEDVRADARLLPIARVAHVVRVGREVRAVGVELVEIRRAVRAAHAAAEPQAVGPAVDRAQRRAQR